ncbi:UDP-N-acetylmuramoyl-L-alanine--D-glutamate ligase [Candidatus Gottesmanbacteria bacterium]|nr:UDP-N-acetylmuramoyl-L-alanine--D-glutamate ligase [Candidatus Gottesmanbacteria bacterium]
MKFVEDLINKRILLVGFAREGVSSLNFLRRHFPVKKIGVFDQKNLGDLDQKAQKLIKKDLNLILFLGQKDFSELKNIAGDFDLIIKSAGIPNKLLPSEIQTKLTTQTAIFFDNFPGEIIGVTGTKGKSTTSSLIYAVLKESGKKTKLLGNIGAPCLDFLDKVEPDVICVFEISSHQLSTLTKSPWIAVILNIYPEHLDFYTNLASYIEAKTNITKYKTPKDFLIYNNDDDAVKKIAAGSLARKIPFNKDMAKKIDGKTKLEGDHNRLNILAATKAAEILDINLAVVKKAVANFKPLPHRLEKVGTYKGITFYNDSLSTIPEAAANALWGLGDRVETLICGGFDRGIDFSPVAEAVLKSHVRNLILFPTTGEKIWQEILKIDPGAKKKYRHLFTAKMGEAIKFSYRHTSVGKICLLSNASPSFGVFKDYADRGNQFKKWVRFYSLEKASKKR